MRLAWATDIHLDFLSLDRIDAFASSIRFSGADALLLTGDISVADTLVPHLHRLLDTVDAPIWFVLGNHDFYGGSIEAVRSEVTDLDRTEPRLGYLPVRGVVALTDTVGLVGVDGWGDARHGNVDTTPVWLNDFIHIEEQAGLPRGVLKAELRRRGELEGAALRPLLEEAIGRFEQVVVATHVPPFREACWHEGGTSDEDWLPYFTCRAVGDVLMEAAGAHPDRQLTVLCGHTHSAGETWPLPNLRVLTGAAEYGHPAVQDVLTLG